MILLDTHAWIWWVTESNRLSKRALRAIRRADAVGVSPLSCWEIAMLVEKERIGLSMDVREWVERALEPPTVQIVPLDPAIAVEAARSGNTTWRRMGFASAWGARVRPRPARSVLGCGRWGWTSMPRGTFCASRSRV